MKRLSLCLFLFAACAGAQVMQPAGYPKVVASYDATALSANVATTTVYAVPSGAAGLYRISAYTVVTQAATTSSTLPNVYPHFTDADTGVAPGTAAITGTSTANTVGTYGLGASGLSGMVVVRAAAGSNIQVQTANYATSGTTAMQYALHVKVEYLGQ